MFRYYEVHERLPRKPKEHEIVDDFNGEIEHELAPLGFKALVNAFLIIPQTLERLNNANKNASLDSDTDYYFF